MQLCRICQRERALALLELPGGPREVHRWFLEWFNIPFPDRDEGPGILRRSLTTNFRSPYCMAQPMPKKSAIPAKYFYEVLERMRERSNNESPAQWLTRIAETTQDDELRRCLWENGDTGMHLLSMLRDIAPHAYFHRGAPLPIEEWIGAELIQHKLIVKRTYRDYQVKILVFPA